MPDINGIPYVESSDLVSAYPAASQALAQEVSDQLASKLDEAGGKILQVVRATDGTERSTTSGTYVDASISVAITPQKSDSAILLIHSAYAETNANQFGQVIITDSSNNAVSGADGFFFGTSSGYLAAHSTLIAYATPATTSSVTYKVRFLSTSGAFLLRNNLQTGQMYAIEVSA